MVKLRATAFIAMAGSLALAACASPMLEAQLQQDEFNYTAAKDQLAADKSAGTLKGGDVEAYKLAYEKLRYDRDALPCGDCGGHGPGGGSEHARHH